MSITKINKTELLDFPNDSISNINTSGTEIPIGYTASCTFPDSATNVALYTMDGNADDSCGSLNLTNTNSVPFVTSSPWGGSYQSADFDPSASPDEYLTIASGLGSVRNRTRSLWIYLDAIPSVFATVLYIGPTGSPNQNYEVLSVSSATTGHVRFQSRYSTGTDADIEGLNPLSTGTWYHVAWVYEGSSIYLYVDGVLQGSTTNTVTDTSSYPAFFGAWHTGTTEFDGKIAQARFYNQALTSAQIVDLYNENETTYYRPTTSLNTGEFRYNEQLGYVEYYNGSNWHQIADEQISGQPTSCICNYPTPATALYEFQNNASDTCGGKAGTLRGTPTYVTGKFGNAIDFNGTTQGITLPSILPANSTSSSSATVWFKTSDTTGAQQTLIESWDGTTGSNGGWAVWKDLGNVLRLGNYYLDGNNVGTDGTINVADGNWHFIAVVFDYSGGTLSLYLDGNSTPEVQFTGLTPGTVNIFSGSGALGYQIQGGPFRYFPGSMDQFRVFSTALTETQITELYNEIPCN